MMSAVLAYARARMDTLDFEEWEDAFAFDNIPRTKFDDIYHLEFGPASRDSEHQDNIHVEVPFTLRVFRRSFRPTKEGRDDAIVIADSIIDEFIKSTNRLLDSGLETVQFDTLTLDRLDDSNDNSLILIIDFTALVVKCTR